MIEVSTPAKGARQASDSHKIDVSTALSAAAVLSTAALAVICCKGGGARVAEEAVSAGGEALEAGKPFQILPELEGLCSKIRISSEVDAVSSEGSFAQLVENQISGPLFKSSEIRGALHELGHMPNKPIEFVDDFAAQPRGVYPETPARSMMPPAYKLLTSDGASPWDNSVKWSLPRFGVDGKWIPGAWQEPKSSAVLTLVRQAVGAVRAEEPGLFVSSSPTQWMNPHSIPGGVLYEVEIGDAASVSRWQSAYNPDFIAQRARLLRPIAPAEIRTLPDPPLTSQAMQEIATNQFEQFSRQIENWKKIGADDSTIAAFEKQVAGLKELLGSARPS